jgi:drug/metabolite transporter (DMT)-like permease
VLIYWIALSISYIVTALGQVIYKLFSYTRNRWHLFWAVVFFAIAPFTSYVALKRIEVGMVFIGAAVSQILILFLSKYFLNEQLNKNHFISMGFIMLGLVLYAI